MRRRRQTVVRVPGRCHWRCAVCDCREGSDRAEEALRRATDGDADEVVLRGGADLSAELPVTLERLRGAGKDIVLRTNAVVFAQPGLAARVASMGVVAARVPAFSHRADVHDRIAGRAGAQAASLDGIRALDAAGVAIELELPLLSAEDQDLLALLTLYRGAAPSLRRIAPTVPLRDLPAAMSPPTWDAGGDRLAQLLAACTDAGIDASFAARDGIPLCALQGHEAHWPKVRFHPRKALEVAGSHKPAPCMGCAVQDQCAGVSAAYLAGHGAAGLRPFERRPRELYEQRTTPKPRWTVERVAAKKAAARDRLVVRPTVDCNQDCPFCSANETSGEVWPDKDAMTRRIARSAGLGARFLSFSGGEPTLSKHLASFVKTGRRLGIEAVELVTNGALLTERRVDELVDAGLTHVFVSLHAHDERLSQLQTRKVGDFARTVNAIDLCVARDLKVTVNHVINTRNHRYLTRYIEFLHARWQGRVPVSFAFITPQYQALEVLEMMPSLRETMPYLRAALHRAVELGQPFHVGSRQGIPPCILGEFRGWSDVSSSADTAMSEDAYQKSRAPQCSDCRYENICTGLWNPYIDRYGTGELRPIPGPKYERKDLGRIQAPFRRAVTFDDLFDDLRERELEDAWAAGEGRIEVPPIEEPDADVVAGRSRPLRVQIAGTGPRARVLARALGRVPGMIVGAVSSPHAPDGDLSDFGQAPAWRDSVEAMDAVRPELLIVASRTSTHLAHVRAAVERGVPVLLEKPPVAKEAELEELLALAERGTVVPAHQVLYAPGIDQLGSSNARAQWTRSVPSSSVERLRTWASEPLFQALYHALVITGRLCGGGVATVDEVAIRGVVAPEHLRFELSYGAAKATLEFDFAASVDRLEVRADDALWTREGRDVSLSRDGRPIDVRRGGDLQGLLLATRDAVIKGSPGVPTALEAAEVFRTARACVDAAAEDSRFHRRANAPRHVASRAFR